MCLCFLAKAQAQGIEFEHSAWREVLKKAQQEPEKYRDLIVRVAGYSAYFVELCKEVQDEIISRTVIEKF